MTLEQFWAIIEEVHHDSGGEMDTKCELLDKASRRLSLEEISSFDEHFNRVA